MFVPSLSWQIVVVGRETEHKGLFSAAIERVGGAAGGNHSAKSGSRAGDGEGGGISGGGDGETALTCVQHRMIDAFRFFGAENAFVSDV
jgi:hypothetical protein|eukprot:COSAG06_NODE_12340_length_1392_cov_5.430781_2_plen_89_part_00